MIIIFEICKLDYISDTEKIWSTLGQHMNEVISNPLPGGGKTINCKDVNLDSSIRVQTIHNGYVSCSPDQGRQSLGLGFLI